MTDLPAPLTPADCDIRGYDFMPLFGHRLFNSEFYARASDAAFRAAVRLWWAAWQQCPAASLPDDDATLCRLADFGRDVRGWRAIREQALHGFIKCSDGRLYHRMLAEEAIVAWDRRRKERERKAKMRAARNADVPRDSGAMSAGQDAGHTAGQDADVPSDRTGQDRTGQDLKEEPLTPTPGGAGGQNRPSDIRKEKAGPRPEGWVGQWVGLRHNGSSPRAIAAAKPSPPEPDHPLWPKLRAKGLKAHDFRTWIAPLAEVVAPDGRPVFIAPSAFHASHVRSNFAVALEHATGQPVEIRAKPDAATA